MTEASGRPDRRVGVVGGLGVDPLVRLSLPARRIIAFVAIAGRPVTRMAAADALWPDLSDEQARANVRRSLWQVPRGWIDALGDELVLMARTDLADAHRAAARAINGGELTLEEIELLSNDILPGWAEDWVVPAQDAFRLLRVQALESACRTMTSTGHYALATQAGLAAWSAEPLRESAAEALIEAHLAQRNRHQAAKCYRSLTQRLEEELGVEPDPALRERLDRLGIAV